MTGFERSELDEIIRLKKPMAFRGKRNQYVNCLPGIYSLSGIYPLMLTHLRKLQVLAASLYQVILLEIRTAHINTSSFFTNHYQLLHDSSVRPTRDINGNESNGITTTYNMDPIALTVTCSILHEVDHWKFDAISRI